ncbi:MAG: AAA family ATPase [Bacteroidales bacterium]|jgi:hypothetical protein|nr:AAA family ATPase [Bacteroidales bacterium]
MKSNKQLDLAKLYIEQTSRNIFLTGRAGTGKTTFLKQLTETLLKRFVVLAPTGVAALNAQGVTIHSFFQLDFTPFVPYFNNRHNGTKIRKEKLNIIRSLDLIIIDEISMVRCDILDAVDDVLKKIRRNILPFGGVQLLLIGDLRQLPPVATDEEWLLLKDHYQSPYFFSSHALYNSDFITIELEEVFRQNDKKFISILNAVRENHITQTVIDSLNERYIPNFKTKENYIQLCTHNHQVKEINDKKLSSIKSKTYSYEADIEEDFPEHIYPNEKVLKLKAGAQIMFIKNEMSNGNKRQYYNGKLGKVVELSDEKIVVEDEEGKKINVHKDTWRNYRYHLNKNTNAIEQRVIGTFTQYPIKLAWAITIHKSQGLTFDKAIIDSNNAFANGQVYVALSRCRTFEGLVLTSQFNPASVKIDFKVSDFNEEQQSHKPDQNTLACDKQKFIINNIKELFDFSTLELILKKLDRINTEDISRFHTRASEKIKTLIGKIQERIVIVGQTFGRQIDKIAYNSDTTYLNERNTKAIDYFFNELQMINQLVFVLCYLNFDNQDIGTTVEELNNELSIEKEIKVRLMESLKNKEFEVATYINLRNNLYAQGDKLKLDSFKVKQKTSVKGIEETDLYKALYEWRLKKSKELKIPVYFIISQKTILNIAEKEPKSLDKLAKIQGIGDKSMKKFGREIMEIISNYVLID